jgi:hypothetical protein
MLHKFSSTTVPFKMQVNPALTNHVSLEPVSIRTSAVWSPTVTFIAKPETRSCRFRLLDIPRLWCKACVLDEVTPVLLLRSNDLRVGISGLDERLGVAIEANEVPLRQVATRNACSSMVVVQWQ